MAVTVDDKLKVIMKDPKAVEVLERVLPGFSTNKKLKLVSGMTLREIQAIPSGSMTLDDLENVEKALAEIGQ
jgi:hypothetical protein